MAVQKVHMKVYEGSFAHAGFSARVKIVRGGVLGLGREGAAHSGQVP